MLVQVLKWFNKLKVRGLSSLKHSHLLICSPLSCHDYGSNLFFKAPFEKVAQRDFASSSV